MPIQRSDLINPTTTLLSAVAALGLSIALWFFVFALGATLNSEQFRNLLNIGSVQTVYDSPDKGAGPADKSTEDKKSEDKKTPGDAGTISQTSGSLPAALPLLRSQESLRSWNDLQNHERQLGQKNQDGKEPAFNPDRTEYVIWRFLGYSPCVLTILLLAITTYTPTNLALLSCLAGLAGAGALRVGCTLPTDKYGIPIGTKSGHAVHFWTTIMRGLGTGFIVYLTAMAGTMIVSGQPFQVSGPADYNRLVATISLASFVLAVRPRLFFAILENMNIGAQPPGSDPGDPSPNPHKPSPMTTQGSNVEPKQSTKHDPGQAESIAGVNPEQPQPTS